MDYTATIPHETLSYIFWHLKALNPCEMASVGSSIDLGWVRVTFVNQRWRRVAIDDATLWATLDSQVGSRWMKEFVRRSKAAPLFVRDTVHGISKAAARTLYRLLDAHHERVASLYLRTTFDRRPQRCGERTLSHSFPNLEELVIWTYTASASADRLCNSLLKTTPRLRRLDLRLVLIPLAKFDWQYPCLPQLTSLRFRGHPIAIVSPRFLDALRQMHNLTQLDLSASNSRDDDIPLSCDHRCSNTRQDVIYLQNMQSLVVRGLIELPMHLFRHIRLPQNARLAIMPNQSPYTSDELSAHYKALSEAVDGLFRFHPQLHAFSWAPSFSWAFMSYKISADTNQTFIIIGLARTVQQSHYAAFELSPFTHESLHGVDFVVELRDEEAENFIARLHTNSVRVSSLHDAGISTKSAHLSLFPNVQYLFFRVGSRLNNPLHGLGFLQISALLPSLRVVLLRGEGFDLLTLLTYSDDGILDAAPTGFPELEDVMSAREQMGVPLQAIYLCVAEEVTLVRAGRVSETSCKDMREDIVREAVRILEATRGVEIVSKDFEVFAAY